MIKVENLCKTFERQKRRKGLLNYLRPETEKFEAVKGVSFEVQKGEMVAFVGPNGAGKSTTIKMMTGIIHPTAGSVEIDGLNPATNRKKLAYKIGCLFGQKSGLWMHLPALDTYKLYGAIYDIDEDTVMKRISELVDMFDIQDIINVPVRKLSLGQRMICEIVGILIHEPEIVFLDEPTIGLDIVVKEKVRQLIKEINRRRKTTVFLTSHDISDVEKLCDRVIIIDNGKIVIDESINSLKEKYMKERIITIAYDENIEDRKFDYQIDKKEGNKVVIRVDEKKSNVASVMNEFLKYGNVIDIESEAVSLEEVIYDIYTQGR